MKLAPPIICTDCWVAAEELSDRDVWRCPCCFSELCTIEVVDAMSVVESDQ